MAAIHSTFGWLSIHEWRAEKTFSTSARKKQDDFMERYSRKLLSSSCLSCTSSANPLFWQNSDLAIIGHDQREILIAHLCCKSGCVSLAAEMLRSCNWGEAWNLKKCKTRAKDEQGLLVVSSSLVLLNHYTRSKKLQQTSTNNNSTARWCFSESLCPPGLYLSHVLQGSSIKLWPSCLKCILYYSIRMPKYE